MPKNQLEVIKKIEDTLATADRPMSLSELAQESELHFTTIKRYVMLIETIKKVLPNMEVIHGGRTTLVRIHQSPDQIQERRNMLKSYFPELSTEIKILVDMFKKNALSKTSAIELDIPPGVTTTLIELERIEKIDGKFYLTDIGKKIASGAIKVYG